MTPVRVSGHPTDSEGAACLPVVLLRGSCENWNYGLRRVYNTPSPGFEGIPQAFDDIQH